LTCGGYQAWLNAKGRTLFCPGIQEAGKTILTSVLVDDVTARLSEDPTIGMFFCNFRRQVEQHIDNLLANLLKQLAGRRPLPESARDLYNQHKSKPSILELSEPSALSSIDSPRTPESSAPAFPALLNLLSIPGNLLACRQFQQRRRLCSAA